jgi:two-component sensor histidine kinase/integral membrane sensor domain MASE1
VIAIGNTLEAVVGIFLFQSFTGSKSIFENIRNTLTFLVPVAMGSTMISATIGAVSIVLGGYASGVSFNYVWWTWWLGDTVGNIVFAPFILSVVNLSADRLTAKSFVIFVILLVSSLSLSFFAFGPWFEQGHMFLYFTLAIIIISPFHHSVIATTILSTLISMIAVWGTTSGYGPFILENMNESLLFLQLYVGTIAATGLILCAVLNERKNALDDLVAAQKQASTVASEKTVLLKELNHRVKNNLQVIISLLNMHEQKLSIEEAKPIFRDCIDRIMGINNVHHALFESAQPGFVELSEYLPLLAKNLVGVHRTDIPKIKIEMNGEKVSLHHEKATSLGMILNELVVNSLKHAFLSDQEGLISMQLTQKNNKIIFSYSDNGRGLQKSLRRGDSGSIGMQIINLLVRQLNGSIHLDTSGSGSVCKIQLPAERPN